MFRKAYTFDDVLLVPQHSSIPSRSNIDTSVEFNGRICLDIPIISANMKTVTGPHMAETIAHLGGMGILHRFEPMQDQIRHFQSSGTNIVGVSVGIKREDKDAVEMWCGLPDPPEAICIDVAHGHHKGVGDMISFVETNLPGSLIIAGNVATEDGAKFLIDSGADVIKVGIGSGSLCTTRVETGNGVPQLTALMECRKAITQRNAYECKLISDGGMRRAGDIVKALCFADAVMLGNMLAGCEETPGEIISAGDKRYKQYVGSSTHKTSHIEGVSGWVPYKGPTEYVVSKIMDGVRSGMSYQGAKNLEELREVAEFVEITQAGKVESEPHDVMIV